MEWLFQISAICLVLSTESLNTAIEKVADFIHPDHNEKIGIIKDISAGAVFFAAIFALFIGILLAGEVLNILSWCGVLLVLISIFLVIKNILVYRMLSWKSLIPPVLDLCTSMN